MIKELISSLEKIEWEGSENVKFALIEGSGDYFCSGFDLSCIENTGKLAAIKFLKRYFFCKTPEKIFFSSFSSNCQNKRRCYREWCGSSLYL